MTLAPDDPRHGTINGYANLRCRCPRCREANRQHAARPNRRALNHATHAINDAPTIQHAYDWLDELANDDTLGAGTYEHTSRSADTTTQPERGASRLEHISADRNYLRLLQDNVDTSWRNLMTAVQKINNTRPQAPVERPTCEADRSLAGYDIPLSQGGWHDPTCHADSRSLKGGLCNRCYTRLCRWRDNHPKYRDRPLDEPPLEHDSNVWIDDNGVAHTAPIRNHRTQDVANA